MLASDFYPKGKRFFNDIAWKVVALEDSASRLMRMAKSCARKIINGIVSVMASIYGALYGNIFYANYFVLDKEHKCTEEKQFKYTICYVLGFGWNAIDWFMPVLVWIKEYHPECKLITLFATPNSQDTMNQECQRFKLLKNLSDEIIYNTYNGSGNSILPHRLYKAIEGRLAIKYGDIVPDLEESILMQMGEVDATFFTGNSELQELSKCLKKRFPFSIIYSHADVDFSKGTLLHTALRSGGFAVDYYLFPDYYKQCIAENIVSKCVLVGAPRGDAWWRAKRISDPENVSLRNRLHRYGKPVVACLIAQQREMILFPESWRMAFSSFMQKHPEFYYIIKFHPRDTSAQRQHFLQQKVPKSVQWEETSRQLLDLQVVSDLIITVGPTDSTTSLLLYDGVPLITFWDSYDSSANYWRPIDCRIGERMLDFFEKNDLVMHADNVSELEQCVNAVIYNNEWEHYKGKYHQYLPNISDSCKLITDFMFEHMKFNG